MKTWIAIFIILGCCLAQAENLQLKNGSILKNVTIISAEPEQMLVVHDGGGCQVKFTDLVQDSLSSEQRTQVAALMKSHVERQARLEELRIEKEAFEKAQLEKGLILFEGNWMSPTDRQQLLTMREAAKLERERMQAALQQERLKLQQAELKAAEGDRLREGSEYTGTFITYSGRNYPSRGRHGCYYYYPRTHHRVPPYSYGRQGSKGSNGSIGVRVR